MAKIKSTFKIVMQYCRLIMITCIFWNFVNPSTCLAGQVNSNDDVNMQKPTVSIRIATPEEEFGNISHTVRNMAFFREHGYEVALPEHEKFKQFEGLTTNSPQFDPIELHDVFVKKVYDQGNYEKGLAKAAHMTDVFKDAIPIFNDLKRRWGFKLLDHYDAILTLYGPGGHYNPQSGEIFLKTDPIGHFKRSDPAHTMIHEIIHIGIHDNIVEAFQLTHWEKERIVDLLLIYMFDNIIKDYKLQPKGEKNLDTFINKNSIMNLPATIQAYVEKYPRDGGYKALANKAHVEIVIVDKVFDGSQAHAIGLQTGDILFKYDGEEITSPQLFKAAVKSKSKKEKIELVIIRKSKKMHFIIKGGSIGIKITKGSMLKENLPDEDGEREFSFNHRGYRSL